MRTFFRIFDNKLYTIQRENIGFPIHDPYYIPDEYLDDGEFVVMRTCHGIGDWCIISSIPRLLKEKYPNCKVYIPSDIMLKNLFGSMLNNWGYGTFDASTISKVVFENNPYVDDFIDECNSEVFHDHYRLYDVNNHKIPLAEQMLKFWQFKSDEFDDSTPDIYFSDEEKIFGDKLINELAGDNNYGYVGVNHATFGSTANTKPLTDKVRENSDLVWFNYSEIPIEETDLRFLTNSVSIKELNLSIRQQMYLRCNAKINVGNETGMTLWVAKYSKTYVLGNEVYGSIHGKHQEGKPRKNPFSSGNFVNNIRYLNNE
tara:strand:+ start:234 stop:1178 length:945 start_codon:yes stop_codon:yes gene_type:complete